MMMEMTSEWRAWVKENLQNGVSIPEVAEILMKNGFEGVKIFKTIFEVGQEIGTEMLAKLQEQGLMLDMVPVNAPCNGLGKPWSVVMEVKQPRVLIYKAVLSPEECDELIALSKVKLKPSTTVDKETGESVPHEHRTSEGTYFSLRENVFIKTIDERLSEIMNQPIENGEGLQILHYQVGGEYRSHFDYFPPEQAGSAVHLAKGGQRVATMILYLNEVEEGGETVFPELGLSVAPQKGSAVYFSYYNYKQVDPLTLHGGAPVVKGEKWIATKWVRESKYS